MPEQVSQTDVRTRIKVSTPREIGISLVPLEDVESAEVPFFWTSIFIAVAAVLLGCLLTLVVSESTNKPVMWLLGVFFFIFVLFAIVFGIWGFRRRKRARLCISEAGSPDSELREQVTSTLFVQQQKQDIPLKPPAQQEEKPVPSPEKQAAESDSRPEETAEKPLRIKIWDALLSGRWEEADRYFSESQKSITDPVKRLGNEALYQYWRYDSGHTNALSKLQKMSDARENKGNVEYLIGLCYEHANQFEKAVQAHRAAHDRADTEKWKVHYLVAAAKALVKIREREEAVNEISSRFGEFHETEAMVELYEGLASVYELAGDKEFQALALEKAIELRPNDVSLRFKLAYCYSQEDGFGPISLQHYKLLLQFDPKASVALNNLGVDYKQLNMPLRAVEAYKKSAELGETLAMANLAFLLLDAGFEEEAILILQKAEQQSDVHENVPRARGSMPNRRTHESEIEEKVLTTATHVQQFQLSFFDAYFNDADCPNIAGEWTRSDQPKGFKVTITQDGTEITVDRPSLFSHYQFRGCLKNRAANLTRYERDWSTLSETKWKESGRGKLYLTADAKKMILLNQEKPQCELIELTRN